MLNISDNEDNKKSKLILFQILWVTINVIKADTLLMNKKYSLNRVLLSNDNIDDIHLSGKEQLIVKYVSPYMERMTLEMKHVFMEYSNIIQRIYDHKDMNYKQQSNELNANPKHGDSLLISAFEDLVISLLNKAHELKDGLYGDELILELSQIFQSLSMDLENYPALLTGIIQIINELAISWNEDNFRYLKQLLLIVEPLIYNEYRSAKTEAEFKVILTDEAIFHNGSIRPVLSMIQIIWYPLIKYTIGNQGSDKDELRKILPALDHVENEDKAIKSYGLFVKIFLQTARTPEKKEILLKFVSLIADIDISGTDDDALIEMAAKIYADTHGIESGAFMWDIWAKTPLIAFET